MKGDMITDTSDIAGFRVAFIATIRDRIIFHCSASFLLITCLADIRSSTLAYSRQCDDLDDALRRFLPPTLAIIMPGLWSDLESLDEHEVIAVSREIPAG